MDSQIPRVLVTGVGGPAGKATATFFRERAWLVIGTDLRSVNAPVHQLHRVPPGNTPRFLKTLFRLLRKTHFTLLVPTVTEELPFVAAIREKVWYLGTALYIPSKEVVEIVNDKYRTAKFLEAHAIPAPRSLLWNEVTSPLEAGEILGYPFVAKPVYGRGGRGVRVYSSSKEAQEENRKEVVYQEFVPGEEFDVNLFVYPAGQVQEVVVLRKTVLKDGLVGNALAVERVKNGQEVRDLAVRAAEVLKLEGPVDMDIRRDVRGTPKILEINARVGAHVLSAPAVLEALYLQTIQGGAL